MSELPKGWTVAPLGEVCGQPAQRVPSADEDFTYIDIASIDRERKVISEPQRLPGAEAPSRARKVVEKGDVIVSMTRPNLNAVALIGEEHNECIASTGFDVLKPIEVEPRWIFAAVRSAQFVDAMCDKVQGALYPAVKSADIREYEIPLPPVAEQTRIAAKLNELLAQVDTLKARIDGIPALLKRFRQSVLAAAVSGRLTEEWRALNPSLSPVAADDLKKAWADVYRSQGKKYKEADLLPGELGYPLPGSWVEAKVGEVFDVYVGATPSRENTEFWGGAIPWVSSSEVAFCRIKETRESITEAGYKSASTTIHPAGTVMLAMIGQGKTRGQPAILDIEACHNQNTAAIRVHPDYCSSEYLYYYLYERYEETRRVGSGNNQQALNKKAVQSLPFPLPPLVEQTEIVRRVEQLFAFADQLEAKVNEAKTRIDRLTQSILAKAFRGELVPQDPNDEPASALLARIQAQRAGAPKAKRGRKASA